MDLSWWIDYATSPGRWKAFQTRVLNTATEEPAQLAPSEAPNFCCYACSATFATPRGLKAHSMKCLGYVSPASAQCFGTVCACCRVQFHCRKRLLDHLLYGKPRCRELISVNMHPPRPEEVRDFLDCEEALRTSIRKNPHGFNAWNLPAARVHGPLHQWAR